MMWLLYYPLYGHMKETNVYGTGEVDSIQYYYEAFTWKSAYKLARKPKEP